MNTQPLVVPVFAVEEAVKALNALAPASETQVAAAQVLQQIMAEGPQAMPPEVYAALYPAMVPKKVAVQYQD